MSRIQLAALLALALASSIAAGCAGLGPAPRAPEGGAAALSKHNRQETVRIRGAVRGLYPGASKRLRVRVVNRSGRRLALRSIRAAAGDASPGCAGANLSTRPRRVSLGLAPHSSLHLGLKVAMIADVADACQGARFPLRFRARVSALGR